MNNVSISFESTVKGLPRVELLTFITDAGDILYLDAEGNWAMSDSRGCPITGWSPLKTISFNVLAFSKIKEIFVGVEDSESDCLPVEVTNLKVEVENAYGGKQRFEAERVPAHFARRER